MGLRRAPFRADADGYRLDLRDDERSLLAQLLPGFRQLLADPDHPDVRRLFPSAHPDDPDLEAEWEELMGSQLLESRFAALDVIERTMGAERLDGDELHAWSRGINDVRLVLGTRLDVAEDSPRPDTTDPTTELYNWLSWLLDAAVRAVSERL
jgi:hypothetical protein